MIQDDKQLCNTPAEFENDYHDGESEWKAIVSCFFIDIDTIDFRKQDWTIFPFEFCQIKV